MALPNWLLGSRLPPRPRVPTAADVARALEPSIAPRPRNIPTPRDVAQALEGPKPGWAARLFGGADPLQQGLLSVDDTRGLGRNALLNAGLTILANSGPAPYRRGLGEILAQGALAGQGAYQQGAQGLLGQQGAMREREAAQRFAAIRQRYQGRTDPASMQSLLHDLITDGSPQALAGARSLAEYLKSQQGQAPNYDYQATVGPDGKPVTAIIDPSRGTTPLAFLPRSETEDPLARERLDLRRESADRTDAERWMMRYFNPQRKAIEAYHLFGSHLAEAAAGNPEATGSLISAFAANADPFNQLRLGMLQYLSDINPSAAGRARIILSKAQSGTLPAEDIQRLNDIVQSNFKEIYGRYKDNYNSTVSRRPELARYIDDPDVAFGVHPETTDAPLRSGLRRTR